MAHAVDDLKRRAGDVFRGVDTARQWYQWILAAVYHERRR